MGRPKGSKNKRPAFKWQEKHLSFCREHYPNMEQKDLLVKFNNHFNSSITIKALVGALKRYQIKSGRTGQFKEGNEPWCKGWNPWETRPEAYERVKAGQFKKGNIPHNSYDQDGIKTKRSDGYWYIRIELGKWDQIHRHNWKKKHGEIPPGHVLSFKDGNVDNYELENIELITQKENYRRNSINSDEHIAYLLAGTSRSDKNIRDELLKYPELIEAQRQQYLLNQKIREYDNKSSNPSKK